jgi:hypothetical protein
MPGLTCRRRDAALGGRQFQESEEDWKEARAESNCFGSNEAYRGYIHRPYVKILKNSTDS